MNDEPRAPTAPISSAVENVEVSAEELLGSVREELDKVVPHLLAALKRDQAYEEISRRLGQAEKQVQERDGRPLIGRLRDVLITVRSSQFSPEMRDWVISHLEETLAGSGYTEFGEEGEPFDPERHEAVVGEASGSGEPVVTGVLTPGLETLGEIVVKARVEVGTRAADPLAEVDIEEGGEAP